MPRTMASTCSLRTTTVLPTGTGVSCEVSGPGRENSRQRCAEYHWRGVSDTAGVAERQTGAVSTSSACRAAQLCHMAGQRIERGQDTLAQRYWPGLLVDALAVQRASGQPLNHVSKAVARPRQFVEQ